MRKTYRITSLFLAVVCLFAFSLFQPVYGLTELSRENRRFAAAAEELNSVWDNPNGNALGYSPLTGEIESERGEYSKDFRRADGAVERVIYSDPVHFEQNGEWQTIDNTLVAETDADGILRYKNTAGDFTVRFGENLSGEIADLSLRCAAGVSGTHSEHFRNRCCIASLLYHLRRADAREGTFSRLNFLKKRLKGIRTKQTAEPSLLKSETS